ncbi:hypothetical protein HAZT_HAZT001823 [Hyalella azteca]|uniref:SET domain-containing protein n=1 Tax=Hyalella azteca TaxID=294128 RepID=A0A6A0HBH2_HYAAZ|nr:hypothetical protein HAZT_HAZT001823 [Hyalella azteca]
MTVTVSSQAGTRAPYHYTKMVHHMPGNGPTRQYQTVVQHIPVTSSVLISSSGAGTVLHQAKPLLQQQHLKLQQSAVVAHGRTSNAGTSFVNQRVLVASSCEGSDSGFPKCYVGTHLVSNKGAVAPMMTSVVVNNNSGISGTKMNKPSTQSSSTETPVNLGSENCTVKSPLAVVLQDHNYMAPLPPPNSQETNKLSTKVWSSGSQGGVVVSGVTSTVVHSFSPPGVVMSASPHLPSVVHSPSRTYSLHRSKTSSSLIPTSSNPLNRTVSSNTYSRVISNKPASPARPTKAIAYSLSRQQQQQQQRFNTITQQQQLHYGSPLKTVSKTAVQHRTIGVLHTSEPKTANGSSYIASISSPVGGQRYTYRRSISTVSTTPLSSAIVGGSPLPVIGTSSTTSPNTGEETETAPEGEGDEMEHDDSITRCVCDFTHDDGYMIQCDRCQVWQHVVCMGLSKDNIPEVYLCEACHPRPVDRQKAHGIQLRKRDLLTKLPHPGSSSDSDDNCRRAKNKTGKTSASNMDVIRPKIAKKKKPKLLDKIQKKIPPKRRRKSSSSATNAVTDAPSVGLSPVLIAPAPATSSCQNQLTYADVVRGWVEGYEAAITNHYSPELRARVHAARINGISPHLRASVQGAVLGHRCRVAENSQPNCLEFEKKILVAGCAVTSGTALLEYQGKYLLWSQWCSNNGNNTNSKCHSGNVASNTNNNNNNNNNNNSGGGGIDRFLPFTLRYTLLQEGLSVAVDARTYGNEARFARRSCKPNAQVRHVVERGSLHLYLVATEDIEEGDEILLPMQTCNTTQLDHLPPCPASTHHNICPFLNSSPPTPITPTAVSVQGILKDKDMPEGDLADAVSEIASPDVVSPSRPSTLSPIRSAALSPSRGSKSPAKASAASPSKSPSGVKDDGEEGDESQDEGSLCLDDNNSSLERRTRRSSDGLDCSSRPASSPRKRTPSTETQAKRNSENIPGDAGPSARLRNNSGSSGTGKSPHLGKSSSSCAGKSQKNRSASESEGPNDSVLSAINAEKDGKKLTREEKKILAYMKAFEMLEKQKQRKQEIDKKREEERARHHSSKSGDGGDEDDGDNSSGDETFRLHEKHRKKNKKNSRIGNNRGSSSVQRASMHRRRRAISGPIDQCKSDDRSSVYEPDAGALTPPVARFPKTKKSMMNEWLNECIEDSPFEGSNSGSGMNMMGPLGGAFGVPSHYMRAAPPSRRSSTSSAALSLANNAPGVSAKKRWLRQAISEEPSAPEGCSPCHTPGKKATLTADLIFHAT